MGSDAAHGNKKKACLKTHDKYSKILKTTGCLVKISEFWRSDDFHHQEIYFAEAQKVRSDWQFFKKPPVEKNYFALFSAQLEKGCLLRLLL